MEKDLHTICEEFATRHKDYDTNDNGDTAADVLMSFFRGECLHFCGENGKCELCEMAPTRHKIKVDEHKRERCSSFSNFDHYRCALREGHAGAHVDEWGGSWTNEKVF